ncbi:hypothetical protein L1987_48127 [Smallanthus sonchifolius]|uniref:Uncharacterized protein n=1 Tax=Smallanthus sonchifolius TaxID=185202 RepID=A0ACB9FQY2_9ASTR|nr:hypothetical protein L1987_48127 [Smallanthus sonchifolius]
MDLFGPVRFRSIAKKSYCLDETSETVIEFIKRIENNCDTKILIIRSDNGTGLKNGLIISFCVEKGITQQFSTARTPQQNGVAERKNRTLIEAARTMLVDSRLPIIFWAEAVNTACYGLNRVLMVKQHSKTPYELLFKRKPYVKFFRTFGCTCTLLNTSDSLPKFVVAGDECTLDDLSTSGNQNIHDFMIGAQPVRVQTESSEDISSSTQTQEVQIDILESEENSEAAQSANDEQVTPDVQQEDFVSSNNQVDPQTSSSVDESINNSSDVNITNLPETIQVEDVPTHRVNSVHPVENIIGSIEEGVRTRSQSGVINICLYLCFLSLEEPKNVTIALQDANWIEAMEDELLQFKKLNVWYLVDLPEGKYPIGTKWVFWNKLVVRNKARLVVQGFYQEEGLDYDDVFASVARIEAIRIFLAYASFMKFKVYQMDVKTAFLYGVVKEEVYVNQPPGFEDPEHQFQVYKPDKALYGLHKAPHAWYETLSTHLVTNGFSRGPIDKTLFLKKFGDDLLLVQVYMDNIIYGSTNENLNREFEGVMKLKFEVSLMSRMQFFLGLLCKKQTNVSTSTAEAEYTAASSCCSQVIWIQHQLLEFGINFLDTPIFCDNEAVLGIVKNPIQHSKTKHIAIGLHFIGDCFDNGLIKVVHVDTLEKKADIFTKPFSIDRFNSLVEMLGMISF